MLVGRLVLVGEPVLRAMELVLWKVVLLLDIDVDELDVVFLRHKPGDIIPNRHLQDDEQRLSGIPLTALP